MGRGWRRRWRRGWRNRGRIRHRIGSDSATLPEGLARFYADLLGWDLTVHDATWVTLRPPGGRTYLACALDERYVEPVWPSADGAPTMQAHLDIEVDDLTTSVADAVARGARVAAYQPQDDVRVLLDPAGHPFCLYLGAA